MVGMLFFESFNAQLVGILNGHDSFIGPYFIDESTEKCCFTRTRSTSNDDVSTRANCCGKELLKLFIKESTQSKIFE